MGFELIDYPETYFRRIKKTEMPKRRSGKFVQIRNEAEDEKYLVTSPKELSIYHANIVERFCMLTKIDGSYNNKKDYFDIRDSDWVVMGGGLWVVDEDKNVLELSGASDTYGQFDSEGLKGKIWGAEKFSGYSILINGF